MIEIPANKYLGTLCIRGHNWNETGKSLRYIMSRACCKCKKEYHQRPEIKEKEKKHRQVPEIRNKIRKRRNEWSNKPEIKKRYIEKRKIWRNKPENKEKIRLHRQKPEVKKQNQIRWKKRIEIDFKYKLGKNISKAMNQSLKRGSKKRQHWETLVGYTLEDLKCHLEKQFKNGMNWSNYGRYGWHIDHIIPVNAFNFDSPEHFDFKRCWALENLQPLWASENYSKHDKLKEPFQPSLAL